MTSRMEARTDEWQFVLEANPSLKAELERRKKAEAEAYKTSPMYLADQELLKAKFAAEQALKMAEESRLQALKIEQEARAKVEVEATIRSFQSRVHSCDPEARERFLGRGINGMGPEAGSTSKITSDRAFPRFS